MHVKLTAREDFSTSGITGFFEPGHFNMGAKRDDGRRGLIPEVVGDHPHCHVIQTEIEKDAGIAPYGSLDEALGHAGRFDLEPQAAGDTCDFTDEQQVL